MARQGRIDRSASAHAGGRALDLDDLGIVREEIDIGKVCPGHDKAVALRHGGAARCRTEQADPADKGLEILVDDVLRTQRADNGRSEVVGQGEQFLARAGTTDPGQDGDFAGSLYHLDRGLHRLRAG